MQTKLTTISGNYWHNLSHNLQQIIHPGHSVGWFLLKLHGLLNRRCIPRKMCHKNTQTHKHRDSQPSGEGGRQEDRMGREEREEGCTLYIYVPRVFRLKKVHSSQEISYNPHTVQYPYIIKGVFSFQGVLYITWRPQHSIGHNRHAQLSGAWNVCYSLMDDIRMLSSRHFKLDCNMCGQMKSYTAFSINSDCRVVHKSHTIHTIRGQPLEMDYCFNKNQNHLHLTQPDQISAQVRTFHSSRPSLPKIRSSSYPFHLLPHPQLWKMQLSKMCTGERS